MKTIQKTITLQAQPRGFHLIDDEIQNALRSDLADIHAGTLHIFLKHTSASLALGENYEKRYEMT